MGNKKDSKIKKLLIILMKKWNSLLYLLMFKKYD